MMNPLTWDEKDRLLLAYGLLWHASDPAADYAVPDLVDAYKAGNMARQALLLMGISTEERRQGIEKARRELAMNRQPETIEKLHRRDMIEQMVFAIERAHAQQMAISERNSSKDDPYGGLMWAEDAETLEKAVALLRAMIPKPALHKPLPEDPDDTPLPRDVVLGAVTFRKGARFGALARWAERHAPPVRGLDGSFGKLGSPPSVLYAPEVMDAMAALNRGEGPTAEERARMQGVPLGRRPVGLCRTRTGEQAVTWFTLRNAGTLVAAIVVVPVIALLHLACKTSDTK